MSELMQALEPFGVEPGSIGQLRFPIGEAEKGAAEAGKGADEAARLIVLTSSNIDEMVEAALEEAESFAAYIQRKTEEIASGTVLDAWRRIAEMQLEYADIPEADKRQKDKDFAAIYAAYSRNWEGSGMLNEALEPAASQLPEPIGQKWIEDRLEDGLAFVPLTPKTRYLAPLLVPMGGFNECPQPLEQALVFRHWQERWEMTPLVVTQDCWVLRAEKRPQTNEEALMLAKEHFLFCPYVLEEFDTIGQYAESLKGQSIWTFWWD